MSFQPLHSRNPVNTYSQPDSAPRVVALAANDAGRRRIVVVLAVFFAAGCVALMATRASGQNYESIAMHPALLDENGNENEALIKRVQSSTKAYVTSGKGNPNMVSGYFGAYVPAKITESGVEGIKNINTFVGEANTFLARAHRSNRPKVAQDLTKAVFTGMKRVAEGNHHPSARIAAILLLSRLDYLPANSQTRTPPIPYLPAYPILRDIYNDENNKLGLRAAALQGLHRHARYLVIPRNGYPEIPKDEKDALVAKMKELLGSEPPAGRSPQVHAYLQRFAVDIIDVLRPSDDTELGGKLVSISTERSKPDLIALYSVERLASMSNDLKGKPEVAQPEQLLQSWTRRAVDSFEAELARLAALERPGPAATQPRKPEDFLQKPVEKKRSSRSMMGMGGGMMGGMEEMEEMDMDYGDMEGAYDEMDMDDMGEMMMGMGGMMGGMSAPTENPQPPEVRATRRKLNHVLQQLHRGIGGVANIGVPANPGGLLASVDEAKKPVVTAWLETMKPIVEALNDPTLDDRAKFVAGLEEQVALMKELIGEEEEAGLPDELAMLQEDAAPQPAAVAAPAAADPTAVGAVAAPAPAAPAPAAQDDPLATQPVEAAAP